MQTKTVRSFTWDVGVNRLDLMTSEAPYNLGVSDLTAEVNKRWKHGLQPVMGMLSSWGRFSLVWTLGPQTESRQLEENRNREARRSSAE